MLWRDEDNPPVNYYDMKKWNVRAYQRFTTVAFHAPGAVVFAFNHPQSLKSENQIRSFIVQLANSLTDRSYGSIEVIARTKQKNKKS